MSNAYDKGKLVRWEWGQGFAIGEVKELFTSEVTRTINGTEVTRKASKSEPAYLIEQKDGNGRVLKSHTEVKAASKSDLYDLAKKQDVDGRSQMSKEELADQTLD